MLPDLNELMDMIEELDSQRYGRKLVLMTREEVIAAIKYGIAEIVRLNEVSPRETYETVIRIKGNDYFCSDIILVEKDL